MGPGDFVPPMLAVTAPAPFSRPGWWFETKWDGYRAIISAGPQFRIYSRRGHDLLRWYPALAEARAHVPEDVVLDAELVAWVDGRPDFAALQQRRAPHYLLMVFDCLYAGGRWLMHEPLEHRLRVLHDRVKTTGLVVVSDGVAEEGEAYWKAIRDLELEGVMAKRLDSGYFPGRRSPVWQKFLALRIEWLWVVAAQQAQDGTWYWHVADRTGTRFNGVGKVHAPAAWYPPSGPGGPEQMLKPFTVEVEYRERTREGHLRHARVRQWPQERAGGILTEDSTPGPHPVSGCGDHPHRGG
ncbi:MAG: DNA ligase [Firmicutes bacterium]|nr:DNA ligase [Bacillota bacterium]